MSYKPPVNPWEPPPLEDFEVLAIKALAAGRANEGQQKIALRVIVTKFAAGYDLPFRPGGAEGARATDFAAGKMFVAQRIVEAVDRPMKISGDPNARSDHPAVRQRKLAKPDSARSKPARPKPAGPDASE